MADMSGLQFFWFLLIGVLFAGFFFLEGFDFGVGMSTRLLAKDKGEREQLIGTIGPVWDANEVWLITAAGAMFASFPHWYASLFSGYYLILLTILFGLIIRGVSFEFRSKMEGQRGRELWDWTLFIGSVIPPFFFGLMFTSMAAGMPIDDKGNMVATFTDYFTPFSIMGALVLTLLCFLHGLNYIGLKTIGDVHTRAIEYAKKLYIVLFVGLAAFVALLYVSTDFFELQGTATIVIVALMVVLSILATYGVYKGKEFLAFFTSGFTIISLVALLFFGLFPRVMVSSIASANDILIVNASSTPYTLKVMTWLSLMVLPFVLAYQGWTYYVFKNRIKKDDVVKY